MWHDKRGRAPHAHRGTQHTEQGRFQHTQACRGPPGSGVGRLRQLESSPSSNPRRHIPLTPTRRTLCARAGDTKVDNLFASLYVVFVYNAVQPHPTITDPALRLANATELGAENPSLAPASGYVYA